MAEQNVHAYTDDKIQTLSALEHIKLRPGMYIGRMGNGSHPDDGIYVLLKEIIDNSIDEFVMGFGKKIEISITNLQTVRVRDYGRGIPQGKLVDCLSVINTGAKYNSDVFQFSVGLNGVGTKAVNALAQDFEATSFREGRAKTVYFQEGVLVGEREYDSQEENGTEIIFTPSEIQFKKYAYDLKFVRKKLWNYAYLNSGLSLFFEGERFYSRNGLLDLLVEKTGGEELYAPIYYKNTTIEFSLTHTPNFGETYYSFVNGQYTNDGGTHQSAFKEGILKAVNEYSNKNYTGDDVRNGCIGTVAIKLKDPIFESQTKNKLGNTDVRGEIVSQVKTFLVEFLYKNPETAEILIGKITQNEKLRKEIQELKKKSKDTAKKAAIKIPKLRDCKYHLNDPVERKRRAVRRGEKSGDDSMIFITEGQSASGSMISCRNPLNQAIFSLKGKPLNSWGKNRDMIYKNEEMFYITQALDIEDGIDSLRYSKVIIATDADVDGLHIRNLLITFFLKYFEQLILSEHVFILETPLFRVRNKKDTIYCYDDEEKENAMAKLGRSCEITRFKGLGEISPKEFGQFIGDNIRLQQVTVDNIAETPAILDFYMGQNTPDRKEYIMNNLL
ncbi:MAG: DNA topoisomerase IV subunit B [Lentisphaeria bacterium]